MRSAIDRPPTLRPIGDAPYDNARLAEAWGRLLLAADECGDVDAYRFDLVNVARQTLSNHAAALQRKVVKAHGAGDAKAMRAAADEFLQLFLDMDELLATRREFLLGRWIADARRWGETDAERARLEWNARRVLTCWGSGGHTGAPAVMRSVGVDRGGRSLPRGQAGASTTAPRRGRRRSGRPRGPVARPRRRLASRTSPIP